MLQWVAAIATGVVPGALLCVLWFDAAGDDRELLLARMLFWTMPFVLVHALVALSWRWRASRFAVRAALPAAGVAVALVALVFWLVPPTMRVQFDETSLVGASQEMQRLDVAVMTTGAVPYDGAVMPIESTVDKRPPLFAFLVHLVHRVVGYRVENAFVVNAALLAIALAVAFAAFRRSGLVVACAAPVCLLAVPLTVVVATSAGFELMASVWLLVAVLAARAFVRQPDDARCAGLCGAAMLLAQSRYESLPAAVLLGLLVLWRVWGRYRPSFGVKTLLALAVPLVLPLVFLMWNAQNAKFYPEAGGAPLVSFSHLREHLLPFLAACFAPRLGGAWPAALGLLALLVLVVRLIRREAGRDDLLFAAPVLAVTAVTLLWFFSDPDEPAALRLYLPICWACALAVPLGLAWSGPRARVALVAGLALLAGLRLTDLAAGGAFPELGRAAMVRRVGELAARQPGDVATTLWVGMPAQYLIVQGRAALTPQGFVRHVGDLQQLRQRGDLRALYFVQTALDAAMAPALGDVAELLRRYPNELVAQSDGDLPVRIYRMR
ncbi:MAG: hypothetical protein H6835_05115 [Planctomycetes bacterium]|nr:hypothetical protein [Planctomycetota bacterium]